MVYKTPTRRKRRAPAKNGTGRKVRPSNGRVPNRKRTPTVRRKTISAKALGKAVPTRAPKPAKAPGASAAPLGTLMQLPDFRQRVIRMVVRKLV